MAPLKEPLEPLELSKSSSNRQPVSVNDAASKIHSFSEGRIWFWCTNYQLAITLPNIKKE
jgi:hypothetical protein